MENIQKNAVLSECRQYRYSLSRVWEPNKPYVLFIGLNPSTADEYEDDPTIRRCIGFAKSWGFGGIYMANLFAFRTPEPAILYQSSDPIGEGNDEWLLRLSASAGMCVAAWGNGGGHLSRSDEVKQLISKLHYLKMNKSGEPAHPLYLSQHLKPVEFTL